MTSQSGTSTQKSSAIAVFSSEVSTALKATQQLQDNVHKLLQTFTEWNSHESEDSMAKVKGTIKDIQSCQRLGIVFNFLLIDAFSYFTVKLMVELVIGCM